MFDNLFYENGYGTKGLYCNISVNLPGKAFSCLKIVACVMGCVGLFNVCAARVLVCTAWHAMDNSTTVDV